MANTKTPVLVGVGQVLQRTDDLDEAKEPLALMVDALRAAAEDAGCAALLTKATSVRVVRGIWKYSDPGRALAQTVGCPSAETAITPFGGNFVQAAVNRSCLDIQAGHHDIILITGGECGRSAARIKKAGLPFPWQDAPGKPDLEIGQEVGMAHPAEIARGIRAPIQMYPIFENALRYERGESIEAHRQRISELWASFSAVASKNPNAWIQDQKTAAEIADPNAAGNRAISFPYPMLMNSNSRVDMGAALILVNEQTATKLGIPREKWVYPHAGSDAHDHYFVSERDELAASPGIRLAGRRCLEMAGVSPGELAYQDVYSCFPSAVQVAAKELKLDTSKPLTVTGGLTFGGGPLNNYVMHGIARMAELLREAPGGKGLCTANGGFLTKHAFGVYSTQPPEVPFQHADLQAEVDALPKREVVIDHDGEVEIESYTVMYEGREPGMGHAACRLPDGRRTWANVTDRDTSAAMTREEFCGKTGRIDGAGTLTVAG